MKKVKDGYKMTELGEIPEEWGIGQLKEISYKIGDGLHGTPIYDENGEYYFINGNNLRNRKIFLTSETKKVSEAQYMKYKKELNNHTLLISLNGTIGNLAYYNAERVVLGKSTGYIMLKEIVDKNYVFYILSSSNIQLHFYKELTGTTIKNLSLNTVRKTQIPIPSLQEQQKIASILSSIDEQMEITSNLIEKTKELKKGLMQKLLTKGIGHEKFKDTEIGSIPEEWEVIRLFDTGEYINGRAFKPIEWSNEGTPIIRIQNLTDSNAEFNYYTAELEEKFCITKGDLLFSWSGSIGLYIWNRDKAYLNQHIYKVVPSDKVEKEYLYYQLLNSIENLLELSHGSTMKHITRKNLELMRVALPNKREQQKIASILSSVDNQIEEYQSKKEKLEELKKGLMQKLLTGKIRVTV